ncbi:unnamed protein product, partial [Scytosiphon promiscuus]
MVAWTTSSISVSEANTLITAVSKVVSICMSFMLASVSLEIRHSMVIRGQGDAIIQDKQCKSIWKLYKSSRVKSLTALAALPILVGSVTGLIIDFTTSGVSAAVANVKGVEVHVLGLVGDGVKHREETNVDETGVYVYGNDYEIPLSVDITFCLEVAEIVDDGVVDAFSIAECREGLIVDKALKTFNISYNATLDDVSDSECSQLYNEMALGNQGVAITTRELTFESTMDAPLAVSATCASITESVIESCVWEDAGVLYFGDWNVYPAGICDVDTSNFPRMAVVGVDYATKIEQGSDTASLLASMTAEIFSGTGLLTSRQQLVDILGAVVRLESMEWDVQSGFDPVEVVEISISTWVPIVLILALLLPAIGWGLVKWRNRAQTFFLPVSPEEWSACAARELGRGGNERHATWTLKPLVEHYDQLYAFGNVEGVGRNGEQPQQRLGWVKKQAVTPAVVEKYHP